MNKWIDIPFKWGGEGFDGADCTGLVRLYLREEFGITLPPDEGPHDPESWAVDSEQRAIEYINQFARRVDKPQRGDIVLIHAWKNAVHTGVMVDTQRMLHINFDRTSEIGWVFCFGEHRIHGYWRVI